ncbi:hypothetical protein PsYK624_095900 [Phanerochaete sordida]|uniref:Heterokaryon incompatibility domain-containing protein n=1 Tax=Phanerochaete sordida TaxID=48140 RepID=A0A9P3LFD3_9APHY|nr:hypothetical protein PsYK624_095900 [Phanerochaete sordida]
MEGKDRKVKVTNNSILPEPNPSDGAASSVATTSTSSSTIAEAVSSLFQRTYDFFQPRSNIHFYYDVGGQEGWVSAADAPWDLNDLSVTIPMQLPLDPRREYMLFHGSRRGTTLPEITVRLQMWCMIKLARSGTVSETHLFGSSGGNCRAFALIPEPRSPIPFQWAHFGAGAISSELADTPCDTLDVRKLLCSLNNVLGTRYFLNAPGLQPCLEHFLSTTRDFGEVYGQLRAFWKGWQGSHADFTRLLPRIALREEQGVAMRRDVLQGGYIQDSKAAPRRVWDLYSNRVVLQHYAVNPYTGGSGEISSNTWPVSHSWVVEAARVDVQTPINGYQWPVPIPRGTTLDHVRVELLNCGAEYVWLDVLCLRQRGRPEDEEQRKEEWKLDVPTIGGIYSMTNVPCITYFNGLGLPFDPSQATRSSDRHWLNRIWTLQEAAPFWLPGGITGATCPETRRFFREHLLEAMPYVGNTRSWDVEVVQRAVLERHCSTELDRVHGLAYILGCKTLPIYDEGISPELAWAMLLKHMPARTRDFLAARHIEHRPNTSSLLPSLKYFSECNITFLDEFQGVDLRLCNPWTLGASEPGMYYHEMIRSFGPIHIVRRPRFPLDTLVFRYPVNDGPHYSIMCGTGGTFSAGSAYMILRPGWGTWIVAEVVRERRIAGTADMMALEVLKRGYLRPSLLTDLRELPDHELVNVVYVG